ncbi:MAG: sensor histidine kinase, partial [Nitrososphaerales archaeon]
IHNVIDALKVKLNGDVSIITRLDDDVQIYADQSRLIQALANILGNAIKFTKRGTINVETHLLAQKNMIEVRISDTGGGIPKEVLPNLFGKFVSKGRGNEEQHGTGLGLFISKAIITAHRGEISAYNNKEGGATFVIVLPLNNNITNQQQALMQSPLSIYPNTVSPMTYQTSYF